MPNGAELLVNALVRRGVDTVFGFPGDTSIALYDVLRRRSDEIRHVLSRDERHAGFMADAYSRVSGKIGVCEAPSGAGAVYLASGIAEALTSSIPLLAITTDNSTRSAGTSAISEMNQDALFAACTKWHTTVASTHDIERLVEEAVIVATEGRPGPVALIIPEDVLEGHASVEPTDTTPAVIPAKRPKANEEAVRAAVEQLTRAQRPVIYAGGGVHLSGAWEELAALVERAAVPLATSIHGKSALDEAHPLALGVAGSNGARDYANAWMRSADCVLFVGTRANATDTLSFTAPDRDSARILHIEADAARVIRNFPGGTALVGDAKTVLAQLAAALPDANDDLRAARISELAVQRRRWVVSSSAAELAHGVLHPADVVRSIAEVFGRDTWVTADAGTPTPYLASYWEAPGDGWRVVIPRGHGPLGFAIPASVAVAVANPDAKVLCLTTENSVAMALAEWETANRLRLPITYVVLDNVSLGWIKMIQHLYADSRYFAVDPGPIDPVQLALGMGVPGERAATLSDLSAAVKRAADSSTPSVIHVSVPEHTELPPPVATWQATLSGGQRTRPIH